jgi:hypothetical protein
MKQLSEAEQWNAATLAGEIARSVAKTQGSDLSDVDLNIVADKTAECFAMGITDGWEILYTCMLHLPYFKDDRNDVERMLNALRGGRLEKTN